MSEKCWVWKKLGSDKNFKSVRNFFWSKKNFGPQRNLGSEKYFGSEKNFVYKNHFSSKNNYGSEKNLGLKKNVGSEKKFGSKKIRGRKNICVWKKFCVRKNIGSEKMLGPKKFRSKKFFGSKIFGSQKDFGKHHLCVTNWFLVSWAIVDFGGVLLVFLVTLVIQTPNPLNLAKTPRVVYESNFSLLALSPLIDFGGVLFIHLVVLVTGVKQSQLLVYRLSLELDNITASHDISGRASWPSLVVQGVPKKNAPKIVWIISPPYLPRSLVWTKKWCWCM